MTGLPFQEICNMIILNAHAEITYASDLNVLNGSAKTGVYAGCDLFSDTDPCILWYLTTCISGPKGLSY